MKYISLLITGMFLLLQMAAAQEHFLISGNKAQPQICMQKGFVTDSSGPFLYLMNKGEIAELPVAGNYSTKNGYRCYEPLYPLATGQQFLLRATGYQDTVLEIPGENMSNTIPLSEVSAIYPASDSIPENILFFHVRFTQAMRQNKTAWKNVHVSDENGNLIPDTWRQRSFWLDSGRLLVLMIHPGRVKSGIHYRGRVFEKQKKYTITADSNMLDFYGRKIAGNGHHTYQILSEQNVLLKPCHISRKIKSGSTEPLTITFCTDVDHASALTNIFAYDGSGKSIACTMQQPDQYRVELIPDKAWPSGKLKLQFAGGIYDCAGNRLNRLFEMKNDKTFNSDNTILSFTIISE